jgi:hypothetical protein
MSGIDDPTVRSILEAGRQVYVAVAAPAGPHVTPELYSVADGRLWFWTAHTTVKAKTLVDDPRIGAVVPGRGRSVVLHGTAERFDPKDLAALPRAIRQPRAIGRAAVRFGLRNAADLGAFATDFVSGRLGRSLPPRRVLFGIRPDEAHVVDGAPPGGVEDAVVAWETDDGPRAFPCRMERGERRFFLRTELPGIDALPSPARVGVVLDDYVAPGPAAKRGTLLRGQATLNADGCVDLVPERTTAWQGVATATRRR